MDIATIKTLLENSDHITELLARREEIQGEIEILSEERVVIDDELGQITGQQQASITRATRNCGHCGKPGHRKTTCPDLANGHATIAAELPIQ